MASTGSLSVLVPPDRAEITGSVAPPESATNDPVARRQGGPPSWRTLQRIWLLLPPCKLEDYCLSPEHPRGRHKARLFREALDIRRIDASWLREVLLEAVHGTEAVELATDAWGTHWRIDVTVRRHGKSALVRTVWIVRTGEVAPRFLTVGCCNGRNQTRIERRAIAFGRGGTPGRRCGDGTCTRTGWHCR